MEEVQLQLQHFGLISSVIFSLDSIERMKDANAAITLLKK